MDFIKLSESEVKALGANLRSNAKDNKPMFMDPLTTGWIPGQDEITDEETINAIKSVPTHYA